MDRVLGLESGPSDKIPTWLVTHCVAWVSNVSYLNEVDTEARAQSPACTMNLSPAEGGVYAEARDCFDPKDVHQNPEPVPLSVRRK